MKIKKFVIPVNHYEEIETIDKWLTEVGDIIIISHTTCCNEEVVIETFIYRTNQEIEEKNLRNRQRVLPDEAWPIAAQYVESTYPESNINYLDHIHMGCIVED